MKSLQRFGPTLLFLLISTVIFLTNYKSGTNLIGWDNIVPEFNLWLNIKRNFFAVWQDYRGLGLLDGQAHSANLIHTMLVFIVRLFTPLHVSRYLITLGLHFLGGVGMYFLANHLIKSTSAATVAGLFYMLNLGIIQQFYAPLETFTFHFGFLPWLFYTAIQYIKSNSKKQLAIFSIIALLMTPQAFVPTIFVVTMWSFLFLGALDIIKNHSLKRFATLTVVLLVMNSFWLLPYMYKLPYKSNVIYDAKINQFSSEETFYRNKARGDLVNVLMLKGFMLDIKEYDDAQQQIDFMQIWTDFSSSNLYIASYGMILFVTACGFIYARSKPEFIPIIGLWFMGLLFLGTKIPILSAMINTMRQNLPFFGEAIRFPFTKFITIFSFSFALLLGLGTQFLKKSLKSHTARQSVPYLIIFIILFNALPALTGNFFSSTLKQKVPTAYRELFAYMQSYDSEARTAVLPLNTFWSWQSKNWGYLGSGFEWFGIQQPLLMRAFDPWSTENEQFFNEASYAMSSEDRELFVRVLKKYNVRLLILDTFVNNELSPKPINFDKLENFLLASTDIVKLRTFDGISLYEVQDVMTSMTYTSEPIRIGSTFLRSKIDLGYIPNTASVFDTKNPDVIYMFPSLITDNAQNLREFDFVASDKELIITTQPSIDRDSEAIYSLRYPSLFTHESLIPARFTLRSNTLHVQIIYPTLYIDELEIAIPGEEYTFDVLRNPELDIKVNTDTLIKSGDIAHIRNDFVNIIQVTSGNKTQLIELNTSNMLPQEFAVPLTVKTIDKFRLKMQLAKDVFSFDNVLSKIDYSLVPTNTDNLSVYCRKHAINEVSLEFGQLGVKTRCSQDEVVFPLDSLPHNASYAIIINNSYVGGLPLSLFIQNSYEQRTELQALFSKSQKSNLFTLYPSQKAFEGYGLHLVSRSLSKDASLNIVDSIAIYPLPLKTLAALRLEKRIDESSKTTGTLENVKSKKIGNFLYITQVSSPGTIVLSQAFNDGWKAYIIQDIPRSLNSHRLVNQWANSWELPDNLQQKTTIVIIFWPQLLQYFGILIVISTLGLIVIKARN